MDLQPQLPRRYLLQLLERPAYQRAFGACTAKQLKTIVTRGPAMLGHVWSQWMKMTEDENE